MTNIAAQGLLYPGCTALRLTSREGNRYWFRTCDIGGNIWEDGAHIVSFPKGGQAVLENRDSPLKFTHAVLGVTQNSFDTWLLDGINDAGLTGGLLALYEGTSLDSEKGEPGLEHFVGMELVTVLLATCADVPQVVKAARRILVRHIPHGNEKVPATMHYMFVDPSGKCVILEAADTKRPGRLTVYEKNLGIMTNSPPYPQQLQNLSWFLSKSPELRWGIGGESVECITLNGLTICADPKAPHVSPTGTFPASYAACDRFIRAAVLSWLNHEGRDFPDDRMLPLGSNLVSSVLEPNTQGVYHYRWLDARCVPVGQGESYTQYQIMYDLTRRSFYLRSFDSTAWGKVSLEDCPADCRRTWPVCHDALQGVVKLQ